MSSVVITHSPSTHKAKVASWFADLLILNYHTIVLDPSTSHVRMCPMELATYLRAQPQVVTKQSCLHNTDCIGTVLLGSTGHYTDHRASPRTWGWCTPLKKSFALFLNSSAFVASSCDTPLSVDMVLSLSKVEFSVCWLYSTNYTHKLIYATWVEVQSRDNKAAKDKQRIAPLP